MKKIRLLTSVAITGLILVLVTGLAFSQTAQARDSMGYGFTYQGQLTSDGEPYTGTCDIRFTLFNAPSGGNQICPSIMQGVSVTNGLFTVLLDFGENCFDGSIRWMQIAVRCPSGSGSYTTLTPRQQLTPAPYALALPGLYTQQHPTSPNVIGGISKLGDGIFGVSIGGGGNPEHPHYTHSSYTTISGGVGNSTERDFSTVGGGDYNRSMGESSTVSGGRLNIASGEQSSVGGGRGNEAEGAVSTIGGGAFNKSPGDNSTVSGGLSNQATSSSSTVSGGEFNHAKGNYSVIGGGDSNTAYASYTTVSGGDNNFAEEVYSTIGGGYSNLTSGRRSTVGGGSSNTASGHVSTVSGGVENIASGDWSSVGGGSSNKAIDNLTTIAGGGGNEISGGIWGFSTIGGGSGNSISSSYATVGGGSGNTISGGSATIPGGQNNLAAGFASFAAGRNAKALEDGCFVWGDSSSGDVECKERNQWVARASGGVIFYSDLTMENGVELKAGGGSWGSASDKNLKENIEPVDNISVLEALMEVPISTWNYTAQDESIRHIGPMSQDFFAAFGVGENDTTITTVDADGVALAAIQGLYAENQDLRAQVDDLEARLSALEEALDNDQVTHNHSTGWPVSWLLGFGLITFSGVWVMRQRQGDDS